MFPCTSMRPTATFARPSEADGHGRRQEARIAEEGALRRATLVTLLAFGLGACVQQSPTPAPRPPISPEPSSTVSGAGSRFRYQCAPGYPFDPLSLSAGDAADGSDEKAGVLRRVLGYSDTSNFPTSGWSEVFSSESASAFVARRGDDLFDVRMERSDGEWEPAGWGSCRPEVVVGSRSGVVEWALAGKYPGPTDRTIEVTLHEIDCRSGRDPRPYLREPDVIFGPDRVYVVVTADLKPGSFECPGNPFVRHEIELGRRLGNRVLYDPTYYPHRPARRRLSE